MTVHVENLSKKYLIHHTRKKETETLKERLTTGAKHFFKKMCSNSAIEESVEEFWALKEVNFTLEQGDRLAIIGRNGAGKSTLLKIISRITPPTEGKIVLHGRVASLLEVGTGFHPELTGKENIYLNGALLGMTKAEIKRKFDEIVAFSEIEKFLDTPVKRYSSGMFVRLGFAVAAHLSPEILVIDEALAVGDARFKKKCISKLEEVGKEGRTIIFVTHDMWAVKFCNKGLFLESGVVVPTKSLDECILKYSGENRHKLPLSKWVGQCQFGHVVIHQFELVNRENSPKLRLRVTLLEPIYDLFIGFMIFNQFGNKMIHHRISHDEGVAVVLKAGSYEFESELDLTIFAAGNYHIELDIGSTKALFESHPKIALSFSVEPSKSDKKELSNTILTNWKGRCQKIETLMS